MRKIIEHMMNYLLEKVILFERSLLIEYPLY